MNLQGKKIILGVTGSIAAYKALYQLRLLVKDGAEVKVIMTKAACAFVQPLSFATLSKNKVFLDLMENDEWSNHVELGLWADLMLVAPCTANTMAKFTQGFVEDMLGASYLSARCEVALAPAMDLDMWTHAATRRNLYQLQSDGVHIINVGHGELASGLVGDGRMAEPEYIHTWVLEFFKKGQDLKGQKILITAGPTYEAIDPVRYIGNRSTGKMGWALAQNALQRGAEVFLILGPNNLHITPQSNLEIYHVESAQQMFEKTQQLMDSMDAFIMAAAVADYTIENPSDTKIKKKSGGAEGLELSLTRTPDIAAYVGQHKKPDQLLIGFALETDDGRAYATQKLTKKNMDYIVLNSIQDAGAGFGHDTNKVEIFSKDNKSQSFELMKKTELAKHINDLLKRD